jgi:hypothetical protein
VWYRARGNSAEFGDRELGIRKVFRGGMLRIPDRPGRSRRSPTPVISADRWLREAAPAASSLRRRCDARLRPMASRLARAHGSQAAGAGSSTRRSSCWRRGPRSIQADQPRLQHLSQRLPDLGPADARLAFEEQRSPEPGRQTERHRQSLIGDVADIGEVALQRRVVERHKLAELSG